MQQVEGAARLCRHDVVERRHRKAAGAAQLARREACGDGVRPSCRPGRDAAEQKVAEVVAVEGTEQDQRDRMLPVPVRRALLR